MVLRFVAIVLLEVAAVVWLATQLCAAPAASPSEPGTAVEPPAATAPRAEHGEVMAPHAPSEPDTGTRTAAPAAPRSEVAAVQRADDAVGVLATGTVRDTHGTPVPEANVVFASEGANLYGGAAKDGTFAIVGLRPGTWAATVRASGVADTERTVELTDAAVQRVDFEVERTFALRVRAVTADGKDATRALLETARSFVRLSVVGQAAPFPERLAPTDYGTVTVGDAMWEPLMNSKDGEIGTLHVRSLPAHVALLLRHVVLQQQAVAAGQDVVTFVVDPSAARAQFARATVRVLDDASGEPIAKARLILGTSNSGGPGVAVDAEGRATAEHLLPGYLRCQISAPEHETMYTTIFVDAGQTMDLGDVRLGAPLPLQGTVLDAEGKPADAQVGWFEHKWWRSARSSATNRSARVEADGTFSLYGTGRGVVTVTAYSKGELAVAVVENPPTEPLVMRLAPASSCVVTRPPDPTKAYVVLFLDAQQRVVRGAALEPRTTQSAVQLPAGDYAFTVYEGERVVQQGRVQFGATPATVEIR